MNEVDKEIALRKAELVAFRDADACWKNRGSDHWEDRWKAVFAHEYLRLVTPNGLASELQP